jgi:hypothetical protein
LLVAGCWVSSKIINIAARTTANDMCNNSSLRAADRRLILQPEDRSHDA